MLVSRTSCRSEAVSLNAGGVRRPTPPVALPRCPAAAAVVVVDVPVGPTLST